jgi:hypothetical protein
MSDVGRHGQAVCAYPCLRGNGDVRSRAGIMQQHRSGDQGTADCGLPHFSVADVLDVCDVELISRVGHYCLPPVIVVMGESGSGKSTIAATLATGHLSEHRTVPS